LFNIKIKRRKVLS